MTHLYLFVFIQNMGWEYLQQCELHTKQTSTISVYHLQHLHLILEASIFMFLEIALDGEGSCIKGMISRDKKGFFLV